MTPGRKILGRMGYLRDQEGIMNRYIREKASWDPHLQRTRDFIRESFKGIRVNSVAILGSGWLLDLPLDEMMERYNRIFLVDIHHPPQIRKRVEDMERVELVEADLTGGAIEQLWNLARKRSGIPVEELMDRISLSPPLEELQPDTLVSLNLMNQLDILLCDFLQDRKLLLGEETGPFRSYIQQFHIGWITHQPGCLITDTVEHNRDRHGNITSRPLIYAELPEGVREEHWSWEFDARGTYRPGTRTQMEVRAIEWR